MTKVRAQVNEETNKNQLPWGHTNLIGTVYLNPVAGGSAVEAPNTPVVAAGPASEVELEFWRSIKDSNKPEELNAYLTNYPNGTFKPIALARIASLQDGPSTATRNLTTGVGIDPSTFSDEASQTTEDQLGLDRSQRRDVQRRLTSLGFDIKASGKFDEHHPHRDHPLAGRPRLSEERLPQRAAAQGAAVRDPGDPRASASSDDSDDEAGACRPAVTVVAAVGSRHAHRGGGGPGALLRRHDGRTVPPLSSSISNRERRRPRVAFSFGCEAVSMPSRRRRSVDNKSARCGPSKTCSHKKIRRRIRSRQARRAGRVFQSVKRQREYQGYRRSASGVRRVPEAQCRY